LYHIFLKRFISLSSWISIEVVSVLSAYISQRWRGSFSLFLESLVRKHSVKSYFTVVAVLHEVYFRSSFLFTRCSCVYKVRVWPVLNLLMITRCQRRCDMSCTQGRVVDLMSSLLWNHIFLCICELIFTNSWLIKTMVINNW